MKRIILLFLIFVLSSSNNLYAAMASSTTGFIPGQIWYSKDPLREGDTVNIYTAVWNGNTTSISAKVEFYDKNIVLGTREITVPPSSLKDVSIVWKVTSGDHVISAKISSSSIITIGKKEQILLDRNTTTSDHNFVPVSLKTTKGEDVNSDTLVKNEITKANSLIKNAIPEQVGAPFSFGFSSIEKFRVNTYTKVNLIKQETQQEINEIDGVKSKGPTQPTKPEQKQLKSFDGTDKPIAYIKLFLFSILGLVFGSKLIFYGLIIIIVFLFGRSIYHKIKNK